MKSGSNEEMFESEFISLSALHDTVPTLAPRPLAWGKFATSDTYYLVTEWIDVETRDHTTGPCGCSLKSDILVYTVIILQCAKVESIRTRCTRLIR